MAEQGTAYRAPKATRMFLEAIEKNPPYVWPTLQLVTVRLDGPIESKEKLVAILEEMDREGTL